MYKNLLGENVEETLAQNTVETLAPGLLLGYVEPVQGEAARVCRGCEMQVAGHPARQRCGPRRVTEHIWVVPVVKGVCCGQLICLGACTEQEVFFMKR